MIALWNLWNNLRFLRNTLRYPSTMYEAGNTEAFKYTRNIYESRRNEVEGISTVYKHPDVSGVVEYSKNKLYFATLNGARTDARSNANIHFFTIDDELVYNNFYSDFGPLNIACLFQYCAKLNKKLRNPANKNKQIVHCTSPNEQKKANSVFLIASYAILYLKKSPKDAYQILLTGRNLPLKLFQDASMRPSIYTIHLLDCLRAIQKAASFGFFNFDDFDLNEYEKYDAMAHGALNWIVPKKFLAFVGPSTEPDSPYNSPECYVDYFLKNEITAVVRLNKKTYDASSFTEAGIMHYDMFMPDGTVPPRRILNQFLQLAENTSGPIAVHCKAGLGRTGSLIAAYLIKHYKMKAREAIAWTRICRPGSVIGHQQTWLENMENTLLKAGEQYKLQNYGDENAILPHKRGIYSIDDKIERKLYCSSELGSIGKFRNVAADCSEARKNKKVREAKYRGNDTQHTITQGDRLNAIKISRQKISRNSDSTQKKSISYSTNSLNVARQRK